MKPDLYQLTTQSETAREPSRLLTYRSHEYSAYSVHWVGDYKINNMCVLITKCRIKLDILVYAT